MKLHLVGGFLGSGKTTAIIAAARQLMRRGKSVGVITNDQGRYLVDTAFYRASDIPAVEVTGGCFCSHYDDLEDQLEDLVTAHNPDIIFAEAIGSSADLVGPLAGPCAACPTSGRRPSA
jgi:G3E family GTPase